METLDLNAMCSNHVEGPPRRWPEAASSCRACGQTWPCDASQLATELALSESRMMVLPAGSTVLVKFNPDRALTKYMVDRIEQRLLDARPDIDWIVLQADELVGLSPLSEDQNGRCTDEELEAAQAGRKEGDRA